MRGILVYNIQYKNNVTWKSQISSYVESFKKLGVELKPIDQIEASIESSKIAKNFNFVLFYDKDVDLAKTLEILGLKVFNSSDSIRLADDKGTSFLMFEKYKIPTPKTYIIPNFYYQNASEFASELENAFTKNKFNFPFVLKSRKSSFGEGVYLCKNRNDFEKLLKKHKEEKFIIQNFIKKKKEAIDYRLVVVDKKIICAVIRKNKKDFRCNSQYGAEWSELKIIPSELKEVAFKVCEKFGLVFAAIDFIKDKNKYFVLDVNSNLFTSKISKICNISVTDFIAKTIIKKLK